MFSIIKNLFHYINNIIDGEEYISDKAKFSVLLNLVSVTRIINACLFFFLGDSLLCFFNVFSFLFYRFLITLSTKSKKYLPTFILAYAEVLVCVLLFSLMYGWETCFNTYCFALVSASFYIFTTSKSITARRSTVFAFIGTLITVGTYVVTFFFTPVASTSLFDEFPGFFTFMKIYNVLLTFFIIFIFSMLFNWEVRTNTATLEKRNNQLMQFANRDPLTRLANRRSMTEHLNLAMHNLKLENRVFSVILCDIDDFKKINDKYGHDCGDKVLVHVANLITSQMRDSDFVCRWGGEEILMIVEGKLPTAIAIAERIRSNISSSEVEHAGQKVKVSMTFGVAQANQSQRVESLIQQADDNLYHGKSTGKNKVVSEIPR